MKWHEILPVVISIIVIILVAIIQKYSKLVAGLTATMPLSAALALWIVYASSEGNGTIVAQFTRGMVLGIIPTVGFLIAIWLCSRSGLKLVPMLLVGYGVWAMGVAVLISLRKMIGY